MWTNIQGPNFEDFYRTSFSQQLEEFRTAMVHAVCMAQNHRRRDELFAFTSVANFIITTAPSYEELDGHKYVQVIWSQIDHCYKITFDQLSNGWVVEEKDRKNVSAEELSAEIEQLIEAL